MDVLPVLFSDVKERLTSAGVSSFNIVGIRAPNLEVGGLEEFVAMGDNSLLYEASCITSEYVEEGGTKWPYTYDYVDDVPKCNIGRTLSTPFPGL